MSKLVKVRRDELCGNPRLKFHVPEHKPSWKHYGKGVANVEITRYDRSNGGAGSIGIVAEETYFADPVLDEKRDTTKQAMVDLDRDAAQALYDFLGEWLNGGFDL